MALKRMDNEGIVVDDLGWYDPREVVGVTLIALYPYIEIDASPAIAQRFTDAIANHCERF